MPNLGYEVGMAIESAKQSVSLPYPPKRKWNYFGIIVSKNVHNSETFVSRSWDPLELGSSFLA